MPAIALIAVDWGTTNRRAWALDGDGAVLDTRADGGGLLSIKDGQFAASFAAFAGDWLAESPPVLMCGMVGSRTGWSEAPYAAAPATVRDLARHLHPVEFDRARIRIVPGVSAETGGIPDVMRGEECQIFGVLAQEKLSDACIILPGTHSKWATVRDGVLTGFRTYITGEVFGLLRSQGTLSQLMTEAPHDDAAFRRGVALGAKGDLLHDLFSVRTLGLFSRLPRGAISSYLSGLLIGSEFSSAMKGLDPGIPLVAVGSSQLVAHYVDAAAQLALPLAAFHNDTILPTSLFAISRAAKI
ncbi:2-dehydro-3-deoxygalactonokinase [soil metagenome]